MIVEIKELVAEHVALRRQAEQKVEMLRASLDEAEEECTSVHRLLRNAYFANLTNEEWTEVISDRYIVRIKR